MTIIYTNEWIKNNKVYRYFKAYSNTKTKFSSNILDAENEIE